MPKHAKNRKNTIQNAKKVIKMSPVTVFTQSLGYNVIFCVFEKGANNILFSIPPYPQKDPQNDPLPDMGLPGTPKTDLLTPQKDPSGTPKKTPLFHSVVGFLSCATPALP